MRHLSHVLGSLARWGVVGTMVALVGTASGCYNYSHNDLGEVTPQDEVRVTVSPERSSDLGNRLGTSAEDLEGEVLEVGEESLLLSVPVERGAADGRQGPVRQRVRLYGDDVVRLESRSLDRRRTLGLAATAGAAAVFLVTQVIFGDDAGGTPRPAPGDGEL